MNDKEPSEDDELRPHYDLKSLRVRKLGPGRKSFVLTTPTSDLKDTPSESSLGTIGQTEKPMSQNFAQVIEHVKQLSFAEKEELHELLKKYLIEERRREILENAEAGMEEMRRGELESFSSIDELMDSLSHD
jgi:hypothetical protein